MQEKIRVKGYVQWAGGREWRGQTRYSIRLKNEDKWFSCGPADPKVNKGDLVEFEYEENGSNFDVYFDSLRVIDLGATDRSPPRGGFRGASSAPNKGATGASKDGYWDERLQRDIENDKYRKANDFRIQYQSARNAAIAFIEILAKTPGGLIIPEKKGSAETVLKAKLEDLTNEFFVRTNEVEGPKNEAIQEDSEAA